MTDVTPAGQAYTPPNPLPSTASNPFGSVDTPPQWNPSVPPAVAQPYVPAPQVDTPPAPPVVTPPAAPAPAPVQLTQEQLSAMLQAAVAQGAAMGKAQALLPQAAVQAEQPEDWTLNELLRSLVHRATYHTERQERSAYAAVDKYFPAPSDIPAA